MNSSEAKLQEFTGPEIRRASGFGLDARYGDGGGWATLLHPSQRHEFAPPTPIKRMRRISRLDSATSKSGEGRCAISIRR
jgi:hypothetical protein